MKRLENQKILVAVTGGIAAYKACDLIRRLQEEGAQVSAMMTPAAGEFITPLTLECLTQAPVYLNNLENTLEGIPTHIALAQQMDAMVILPCSANTLAKLAYGMADNLVTTTAITFTDKPIVIAPAMNTRMWMNPLVQKNLSILSALSNTTLIPPDTGSLACGEEGEGKLADLDTVLLTIYQATHPSQNLYQGKRVVVTAGATQEPIDPVRAITNRGSGKMGIALADELFAMGADVCLIHTLPSLHKPYQTVRVQTVEELGKQTQLQFKTADGLIMAAAVSDFKVAKADQKIKKQPSLNLSLEKTDDILQTLSSTKKPGQFTMGFAAESENMLAHAQEKLRYKQLDMIVANDISRDDIGFQTDENEVTLLFPDKPNIHLEKAPKWFIARDILIHANDHIAVNAALAR